LMEKLGIDWQAKKAEFEAYLKEVEAGKFDSLYDPRLAITSGPGFKGAIKAMAPPVNT
jgi:heterodisulfide reductase subunit B2